MENKDETTQFKVTLTLQEIEILREFSELQGKPMASCFMYFVREANLFKVMDGTNKAMKGVLKMKNSFRKNVENVSDEFSVVK